MLFLEVYMLEDEGTKMEYIKLAVSQVLSVPLQQFILPLLIISSSKRVYVVSWQKYLCDKYNGIVFW